MGSALTYEKRFELYESIFDVPQGRHFTDIRLARLAVDLLKLLDYEHDWAVYRVMGVEGFYVGWSAAHAIMQAMRLGPIDVRRGRKPRLLPCPRCRRRGVVVPESAVHSCPRCSSEIKAGDVARRA